MTALVHQKQVPGLFNFTQQTRIVRERFILVQVNELEESTLTPSIRAGIPDNHCMSCNRKPRSDLPLMSDFGDISSPYDLIYARLEGLQYYSKSR